ncbi:hypothetical protein FRX31_033714, partial [Thalictrum thalictroides]
DLASFSMFEAVQDRLDGSPVKKSAALLISVSNTTLLSRCRTPLLIPSKMPLHSASSAVPAHPVTDPATINSHCYYPVVMYYYCCHTFTSLKKNVANRMDRLSQPSSS